jgi:glycosyltransferase involved in cell wall biosynthesis
MPVASTGGDCLSHNDTNSHVAIYYLCPDQILPTGGVKVIYRHVAILRAHGYDAYVMHGRPGFRPTWFASDVPVVYWTRTPRLATGINVRVRRRLPATRWQALPSDVHRRRRSATTFSSADVIVVPEIYADLIPTVAPGVPKVVFCQNAYGTFTSPGPSVSLDGGSGVRGVFVVSRYSENLMTYAIPSVPTFRLRVSAPPSVFRFTSDKARQVAFMPRKNPADARSVMSILASRKVLSEVDFRPIDNVSEAETGRIMRESLLFLSFGHPEGFGLPAAEAMLCGCVVVGYDGLGGREYFRPEYSYPVRAGDVGEVAKIVERIIAEYDEDPAAVLRKGRRASESISHMYSPAHEAADLLGAWRSVLEAGGDP